MNLDLGRAIADAVLYEGYLLYPYRASSSKNQTRWQFGVVSPPGAAEAGLGERPSMTMQCLLVDSRTGAGDGDGDGEMVVHLRFLHLQRRQMHDAQDREVTELVVDGSSWTSWDEAVERELDFVFSLDTLADGVTVPVRVERTESVEAVRDASGIDVGRVVRRTWPLSAELSLSTTPNGGYRTFELNIVNTSTDVPTSKEAAIRAALIGAHVLVEARGFGFVSMVDPPEDAAELVAACTQDRCWPVLTGAPGDTDLLLGSPIILYDHPEIAAESDGSLFDGTEIDEILTLRVMTMTEQEKAEARATDPRAREIIDRCDQMTPETLQQMHGVLRNPHAGESTTMPDPQWPGISDVRNLEPTSFETGDVPWWSPEADDAVRPGLDAVVIDGVSVARDSLVRVHPSRRADAQDLFFDNQVARVTAVLSDVDGGTHVALVLLDDPAGDIYDLSGRYWYFAPDEVTPLSSEEAQQVQARREEIRP